MLKVLYIEVSGGGPVRGSYVTPVWGWSQRGVEMHYLSYVPRGFKLQPAPETDIRFHLTYSRSKLTFPLDALRLAAAEHRRRPFDVVVATDPMGSGLVGYWLQRRFGLPLVIQCHTGYFGHYRWVLERPYYPFYHLLARFLLLKADLVQAVGRDLARTLLPLGVDPQKIAVCTFPVKTHFFDTPAPLPERPWRQELLFVGRFSKQKGLFSLLQALRLLLDAGKRPRLTLVGEGELKAALKQKADKLGIRDRITFAGFIPASALARFYRACDVFVLPSLYEGLCKVLVEAALCGAPTVTTRVVGAAEMIVDGETGLLVPPDDSPALAAAISRLDDDPARARAMGEKARLSARQLFDYERIMDKTAGLWFKAAGQAGNHGHLLSKDQAA